MIARGKLLKQKGLGKGKEIIVHFQERIFERGGTREKTREETLTHFPRRRRGTFFKTKPYNKGRDECTTQFPRQSTAALNCMNFQTGRTGSGHTGP